MRTKFARSILEAFADERAGSVSGPFRRPLAERIASVLMAVVLGICGAAWLFHYWSS